MYPVVLLWMEAGSRLADCSSPLFQLSSVDAPIALVLRLYQRPPCWSLSAALMLHRGFSTHRGVAVTLVARSSGRRTLPAIVVWKVFNNMGGRAFKG